MGNVGTHTTSDEGGAGVGTHKLDMRVTAALGFMVLASACIGLRATYADEEPDWRWVRAGDITLNLELLTRDGTISAGEPLLGRIQRTNQSGQHIHLLLGSSRGKITYLTVRDGDGELVAAMPRATCLPQIMCPQEYLGGMSWRPGENRSEVWVITGWYQFQEAGEYTVHVQLLDRAKEGLPVISEDRASVRVTPFDGSRLEARCDEIFQPLRKGMSSRTDVPMVARVKALYSVRNDIVLPYLDWIARQWPNPYTCDAIRRIGTERAEKLLDALAAREDRVGKEVRKGAKRTRREPMVWDVVP